MSTLEEHLSDVYEVDVDEQLLLQETGVAGSSLEAVVDAPRFIIDDEDKANWALRKLARLNAQLEAVEEQARRERERIATWVADVSGPLNRQRVFFESLLEGFHREQLSADPNRRTIKLPAGTLKIRKTPASVELDDNFVEWAQKRERDDLLRVKVEPNKAAIREAVLKDGEAISVVTIVAGELRFSVEVSS